MRPPPDCRPSVGASAPKGTCRWLSPFGGSAVRTALNYNYHRAADDLNTRRGIVSGRVALLPRSTEIQPFVAKIRPSPFQSYVPPQNVKHRKRKKIQVSKKTSSEVRDFYLVKFTLTPIFQIDR
ncbi:hypothetical protein YC2023_097649 [Brassica napus]